jgi:hypothetical protein
VKTLALPLIVALAASIGGCGPGTVSCPPGERTMSARAQHTTITAPPGGGGHETLTVFGRNFTPNASFTIGFHQYPARDPSDENFQESATTAGDGSLSWTKDLFQLPPRAANGDPNVDVFITGKDSAGCLGATMIKAGPILNPPLR